MDFLQTIIDQSELLGKEVKERNEISFLTVANDEHHGLAVGSGNSFCIAHSLLEYIKRNRTIQKAILKELGEDELNTLKKHIIINKDVN